MILGKRGSFQKSPFSGDSIEFRDFRDSRKPPDCGKQRTIRPCSRDSREFIRSKVCTGDFAPPEPEFGAEFWETNFGRPNFGPEFLGRII